MRADTRIRVATLALAFVAPAPILAQSAADGPVLAARRAIAGAAFKAWVPAGTVRLVGWDHDSVLVRGRVAPDARFYFAGDSLGAKFGVEHARPSESSGRSSIVVYVPRGSRLSMKTVSATVDAVDVSGWFYSVSGSMHLSGTASSIEAETMTGSLDLDASVPWLRARTGSGHLLLRGTPEDVDVATVAGTLDIATTSVQRGQFGSVSGDIHYVGSPRRGAIMEFSSHSGNVELMLPRSVSGVFSLSSIAGAIELGFRSAQPAATPPRSMRLSFGGGGSQVTVRTFRGAIRLRPQ